MLYNDGVCTDVQTVPASPGGKGLISASTTGCRQKVVTLT